MPSHHSHDDNTKYSNAPVNVWVPQPRHQPSTIRFGEACIQHVETKQILGTVTRVRKLLLLRLHTPNPFAKYWCDCTLRLAKDACPALPGSKGALPQLSS